MIIVLRANATQPEIDHVLDRIKELGLKAHLSRGEHRTIIGVIGDETKLQPQPLQAIPGVEQVLPIMKPFKLASREFNKKDHYNQWQFVYDPSTNSGGLIMTPNQPPLQGAAQNAQQNQQQNGTQLTPGQPSTGFNQGVNTQPQQPMQPQSQPPDQ